MSIRSRTEKLLHELLRWNVVHGDFVLTCGAKHVLIERRRSDAKGTIDARQNRDARRRRRRDPGGQRDEHWDAGRLTPLVCLNVERLDGFVVTI